MSTSTCVNMSAKLYRRLNKFTEELSHWHEYNYVVINDDLNKCYEKILNIIMSEKRGVNQKQKNTFLFTRRYKDS